MDNSHVIESELPPTLVRLCPTTFVPRIELEYTTRAHFSICQEDQFLSTLLLKSFFD